MEGLGAAASIIAVVSVALQLADSAKKLHDFWQAIDEAPASIRSISTDLKLLSTVLAEIALHEQKYGKNGTITDILEICVNQVKDMLSMTSKLEAGFDSSSRRIRKWSAVKAVFKEDKIAKFQALLLQTKTTLLLAQKPLADAFYHYLETNGQTMALITKNMANLQLDNTQKSYTLSNATGTSRDDEYETLLNIEIQRISAGICNPLFRSGFQKGMKVAFQQVNFESLGVESSKRALEQIGFDSLGADTSHHKAFAPRKPRTGFVFLDEVIKRSTNMFGTVVVVQRTLQSRRNDDTASPQNKNETQISFVFRPSPKLIYIGMSHELRFSLLRNCFGWRHQFQTFQPVADDALIFEFCANGNVEGVKALLSRKEASVWDVNSMGWTPLHFAMHEVQTDTSNLLLVEGADVNAVTYSQLSCRDFWLHSLDHIKSVEKYNRDKIDKLISTLNVCAQMTGGILDEMYSTKPGCAVDTCNQLASTTTLDFPDWNTPEWHLLHDHLWTGVIKAMEVELQTFAETSTLARLLHYCSFSNMGPTVCRLAIRACSGLIDARDADAYTAIFTSLIRRNYENGLIFASHGADLHMEGIESSCSPYHEIPTSLSLYTSDRFFEWRNMLRALSVDTENFIGEELQQNPLKTRGWTTQSLQSLFDLQYASQIESADQGCECEDYPACDDDDECCAVGGILVDVLWQTFLEELMGDKACERSHSDADSYVDSEESTEALPSYLDNLESEDSDVEEPRWLCVHCWHGICGPQYETSSEVSEILDADHSPRLDEEDENSPFLLSIPS